MTIGADVEEAAADLGAPPWDVLWRVLLPLLAPAIVASLLVAFALSIDDFVVSQYLASGADTTTVPMRIYAQARAAPTPALNALATLMLVVVAARARAGVPAVPADARASARRRRRSAQLAALGGERDERAGTIRLEELIKRYGDVHRRRRRDLQIPAASSSRCSAPRAAARRRRCG